MNDSFDTAVGPTNHLCKFPLSHKHSSSTVCIPDTELGSMYTEVNLVRIDHLLLTLMSSLFSLSDNITDLKSQQNIVF